MSSIPGLCQLDARIIPLLIAPTKNAFRSCWMSSWEQKFPHWKSLGGMEVEWREMSAVSSWEFKGNLRRYISWAYRSQLLDILEHKKCVETKNLKSRCWQGWFLLETARTFFPGLAPSFWQLPVVFGLCPHHSQIWPFLHPGLLLCVSPLCPCVSKIPLHPLIQKPVFGFRAYPTSRMISCWDHELIISTKILLPDKVDFIEPRLRTWTCLFRRHNSTLCASSGDEKWA